MSTVARDVEGDVGLLVPVAGADEDVERRRDPDHVAEGQTEPRDLVGGAGLGDRHLVLEVAGGEDSGDDVRRHAARPDAAAGDRKLLPDAIGEEGDRAAVPRLEMGHHGEELVPLSQGVVDDVEEGVLVDLHSPAPDGLVASDRGKPSVRRELEGPGRGRDFDEDRRRRGDWRIGTERRARGAEKPEGNRCGEPAAPGAPGCFDLSDPGQPLLTPRCRRSRQHGGPLPPKELISL